MKKALTMMITALLLLMLAACAGSAPPQEKEPPVTQSSETTTPTSSATIPDATDAGNNTSDTGYAPGVTLENAPLPNPSSLEDASFRIEVETLSSTIIKFTFYDPTLVSAYRVEDSLFSLGYSVTGKTTGGENISFGAHLPSLGNPTAEEPELWALDKMISTYGGISKVLSFTCDTADKYLIWEVALPEGDVNDFSIYSVSISMRYGEDDVTVEVENTYVTQGEASNLQEGFSSHSGDEEYFSPDTENYILAKYSGECTRFIDVTAASDVSIDSGILMVCFDDSGNTTWGVSKWIFSSENDAQAVSEFILSRGGGWPTQYYQENHAQVENVVYIFWADYRITSEFPQKSTVIAAVDADSLMTEFYDSMQ